MSNLVQEQGTVLDRIDYNIECTQTKVTIKTGMGKIKWVLFLKYSKLGQKCQDTFIDQVYNVEFKAVEKKLLTSLSHYWSLNLMYKTWTSLNLLNLQDTIYRFGVNLGRFLTCQT